MNRRTSILLAISGVYAATSLLAQPFQLPTANRNLFASGAEEKFFVGTIGKPWTSGTFGCVRSDGRQFHEGLDIKCQQRDKRGEPIDPVQATADGTVVYFSKKSALSNYGNYLVIRHHIEGLEIYSLYAHLREIRADLKVGQEVRAGENIATLGRSTNTREGISRDRAHVHFELNFFVSDRFATWYKSNFPKDRNDHGLFNGHNLIGCDPREVFLAQKDQGDKFSLVNYLRGQTEMCRVMVRRTDFSFLKRYAPLVWRNPIADKEGVAAYEISLTYFGLPFKIVPRAASELKSKSKYHLLSVNEAEYNRCPCRKLVSKRSGRWELASGGISALDLLTQ